MNFGLLKYLFSFYIILISTNTLFCQTPKPDSVCGGTNFFCNSADFWGPWDLPDSTHVSGDVCDVADPINGQFSNPLFFAFVASDTIANIKVIVNSLVNPNGTQAYQYGIVDSCYFKSNGHNYIECSGDSNKVNTVINAHPLEIGHTYYLYLDGYNTCAMNFNLSVLHGVDNLIVDPISKFKVDNTIYNAGDTINVCHNGTFRIEPYNVSVASSFNWILPDSISFHNKSKYIDYKFIYKDTIIKVEVQAATDCKNSISSFLYFKVDTLPDEILPTIDTCETALSSGIKPNGWFGGYITNTFNKFKVVQPNGCYYYQIQKVNPIAVQIISVDTFICGDNTVQFGNILVKHDTIIQKIYTSNKGCDSIVNKEFKFLDFKGTMTDLDCNAGTFKLSIIPDVSFDLAKYDSLVVKWYRNGNLFNTTKNYILQNVSQSGKYNAVVYIYKQNHYCTFTLNSIDVGVIPNVNFTLDKNEICLGDTINLKLNNYSNSLLYNFTVPNSTLNDKGNGNYQIIFNKYGNSTIQVKSDFNGCQLSVSTNITIKQPLEKPKLKCLSSTNNSVQFDWTYSTSDCLNNYEVYLNGIYSQSVSTGPYSLTGLNNGEKIKIQVKSTSNCVCPIIQDTITCQALPCPSKKLEIIGVPQNSCSDKLLNDVTLVAKIDTSGVASWSGNGVDSGGKLEVSKIKLGTNHIYLDYKVGGCQYSADTSFEVYEKVSFRSDYSDISCYNNKDGYIAINPLTGTPAFSLFVNGQKNSSFILSNLDEGIYKIKVTDANNCSDSSSVTINKPVKPIVSMLGEKLLQYNKKYTYHIDAGNLEVDSIFWYRNDTLICDNSLCEDFDMTAYQDSKLCAEIFFDSICSIIDCIELRILKDNTVLIPNTFTPNGDEFNDYFSIHSSDGQSISVKEMKIFSRWGEKVYEKSNFIIDNDDTKVGWDGTYKGQKALPGIYVFYYKYLSPTGQESVIYGDLTLIR